MRSAGTEGRCNGTQVGSAAEVALRAVIDACVRDHPEASRERVATLVRTSYERTSGAKVHQYRVLLAERDARAQLRSDERARTVGSARPDPRAQGAMPAAHPPAPAPTPSSSKGMAWT